MPYIKMADRPGARITPESGGDLNFIISDAIDDWLLAHGLSYNGSINVIVGALECAKLEFYRRIAAPYEDQAIVRNGDVYHASNYEEGT